MRDPSPLGAMNAYHCLSFPLDNLTLIWTTVCLSPHHPFASLSALIHSLFNQAALLEENVFAF